MRRLLDRLTAQEGIALPVALAVLVIVGALAAATIDVAVRTNHITGSDSHNKAALAAADAGITVAVYRLNMLAPDDSHCVTTSVQAVGSNGYCPIDGPESLGNGSSFSFQVTPKLTTGSCAGLAVDNSTNPVSDRCVTAIGTADGVSVRTEARVAAWSAQPFFPFNGITGLSSVTIAQNSVVTAGTASNGVITLSNNSSVNGVELGLGGSLALCNTNCPHGNVTQLPTKLGLAAVPIGTSPASNDDGKITSGQDPTSGATWTPSTRSISFTNLGSSITFGTGLYNVCNFVTGNNTLINVANGAKVVIIIDSPSDPNSGGCPAGSGNLSIGNGVIFNDFNATPQASDLQFYVYGNGNNVEWGNGDTSFATLFAPNSTVDLNNVGTFTGNIAANSVNVNNVGLVTVDASASGLNAQSQGLYYKTAWQQCPAQPTSTSDLSSGC